MISFSQATKDEIANQELKNENAAKYEMIGFFICNETTLIVDKNIAYELKTNNAVVARRVIKILKQIAGIKINIITRKQAGMNKNMTYIVRTSDVDGIVNFLGLKNVRKFSYELNDFEDLNFEKTQNLKAFLKGCFLANGSINNPNKSYSLQIPLTDELVAKQIQLLMIAIELNAKIVTQKEIIKVYIKEGESIANLLVFLDATEAMTTFESVRIIKEMRNEANRMNNIELANTEKTYQASLDIIEKLNDINRLVGFESFNEKEQAYIRFRISKPELSMNELAEILNENDIKATKSSLNHFFRKVKEKHKLLMDNIM